MAGISIELKRKLSGRKLSSIFQTFAYSAFLSSGAWVISILSIILASYIAARLIQDKSIVLKFQTSVTYLIAFSLILSGPFQLYFSRFAADRIFEKDYKNILPNFMGLIVFNMTIGFILYLPLSIFLFRNVSAIYTLISLFSFVILCGMWIATSLFTALKSYNFIVYSFILGYAVTILMVGFLGHFGLNLLMFAFFVGQTIIFIFMVSAIIYNYPSDKIISFDFLKKKNIYISLIFTGFFYNLGIWADKFVFWFSPITGNTVFAHLRASAVYDAPIFLAYLSIVPGMAVFFLKLEGEFAGYYEEYYRAVIEGKTIEEIYDAGNKMISSARGVFFDVMRIQAIADIILILFMNDPVFKLFGISLVYIPLFHILLVGTMLQLLFIVAIGFLFYFDKRNASLFSSMVFFLLNLTLSIITVNMGPYYYGYGYAVSLLISIIISVIFIRRFLNEIHYYTYMFI